jgi:hypothetical protein
MKAMKIITHPYTLIISFFAILISGQNLGGFYLLYLLLALPPAGLHSILAFLGVVLLLVNHYKYKRNNNFFLRNVINIGGLALLILSLFLFFYNDKQHYNYGTFYQAVPLVTLIIFATLALIFLGNNLTSLLKNLSNNERLVEG